ncbi:hypothetical protein SLE2022_276510 [Rubroshorea leprosula]
MDNEIKHEGSVSVDDFNSVTLEPGSIKVDISDGFSSHREVNGELERVGELITRVELDLACSSEKLVNLSILTMHMATRESDFESSASENDSVLNDSVEKVLEFDLLTGILDSEVKELDKFICSLQTAIANAHEMISSFRHLGETFVEMEKKLHDSEESLKQSQDQASEIKVQCAKFQRTLSCLDGNRNWSDHKSVDLAEGFSAKIRMQTAEEQRHILRMLEKSLAREMDLEKKLAEFRQIEQELKIRLLSSEQEVFCMEEEVTDIYERCFEAENSVEVLKGISKDLLARQQMLHFYLNNSIYRETELRSKLDGFTEKLEAEEHVLRKLESSNARVNDFFKAQNDSLKARLTEAENKLILADSEIFTLREIVSSMENQQKESESKLLHEQAHDESEEQNNTFCFEISELENVIEDLKEELYKAENRVESAEAKCKLLDETNMELNEELGLIKDSGVTAEKLEALEKQLKESDIQLQHAIASAEASEEKQKMLYLTIGDMEALIEDLKLKVSKAESRAENAEGKCIILCESNAELSEELSFLRGRLDCLEASLNKAEEMKMATVKDIDIHTKIITNLLTQLAVERERLHQQMSALAVENKILIVKLKKLDKYPSMVLNNENTGNCKEYLFSKQDLANAPCARESKEVTEASAAGSEVEKTWTTESVGETEMKPADATSEFEIVRRIDARLLNLKHIFMALTVLMISVMAYFFDQKGYSFK